MTKSKLFKIAAREYLQTVKKKSFWLSTFALPLSILALSLVSSFAANYAEKQIDESTAQQNLIVVDELSILNPKKIPANIQLSDNYSDAINKVKESEAYAAVLIPKNLVEGEKVKITFRSNNALDVLGLEPTINKLLKSAVVNNLENTQSQYILSADLKVDATGLNDKGEPVPNPLAGLVMPVIGIALYMILVTFSTSYLLRSVSEEKENRMIEIMLTNASAKQLVWGKVLGQIGIVFTQMLTLAALCLVALLIVGFRLPLELLTGLNVTPLQVFWSLVFVLLGFLSMAGLMVMAASAVPTYREAQSFSTVFILVGILPIYLLMAILAQPNGSLAITTSLIPLTSPLVMVMRLGVTNIPGWEIIGISLLNLIYALVCFVLAFKVFELNAVEYTRSFSFRSLIKLRK